MSFATGFAYAGNLCLRNRGDPVPLRGGQATCIKVWTVPLTVRATDAAGKHR